jgi:AAA+ ATPase superfamily predicted ATPase
MRGFVGRGNELRALQGELEETIRTGGGRLITIRGRRQVGKSWLVEQWLETYSGPSVFFEAHGYTETRELERFRETVAKSSLPSAANAVGLTFADWQAALVVASANAEQERPTVIILDEFPDLCDRTREPHGDPAPSPQEGAVRAAWRELQKRPVVLVLVGSDLAMMERLTTYGSPLYQRPTRQLVVDPLSALEVSRLTGRTGADALDAYLVTGGFPQIVRLWPSGSLGSFLRRELADPSSEFVRGAERILDGELPAAAQARTVLSVIGAGERAYAGVVSGTGIKGNNLHRPLATLADKRIVASALPLSGAASDARRYHVADPYLRFWLRFVEPIRSEIGRGIGATNVTAITRSFADYAGRAVEPIIRSGIERRIAGGDPRFGGARIVGGFWTRDNQVEVDLVGADRESPPVKSVGFVGSIKWRVARPLDGHDVADLERAASRIVGATPGTTVVGVSRAGFAGISRRIVEVTPDEILEAFPAD